jgi:hypothetical protein
MICLTSTSGFLPSHHVFLSALRPIGVPILGLLLRMQIDFLIFPVEVCAPSFVVLWGLLQEDRGCSNGCQDLLDSQHVIQ